MTGCSDPSHLPLTTYHLPTRSTRSAFTSQSINAAKKVIHRSLAEKRQAEPLGKKINRWIEEAKAIPAPPRNAEYALPSWTSREQIAEMLEPLLAKSDARRPYRTEATGL
jgi:hypothetical protein